MKQFSAFGTVTSVRLEKSIAGGDDEASTLVALIKYENRIDAEKVSAFYLELIHTRTTYSVSVFHSSICMQAKSEIAKLSGSLTCTWHKQTASASKSDAKITDSKETNEAGADGDGDNDDEGLYDDVYDGGEDDEEAYYDDEPANGDYEGEEDFVDYD